MIYPIRVDVSSKDNGLRIMDTILLDPTCLPIPPSTTNKNYNSYNLYSQTILQNASFFAKNLLADMEVDGINKTEKIGRIRLVNNNDLIMMVENQIQKQLKSILEKESKRKIMYSTRNINHYSKAIKKRKLSASDDEEKADNDKVNEEEDASMESTEQEVVENDNAKEEGDSDNIEKEETDKITETEATPKEDNKNDTEHSKKQQDIMKNLKTIYIRIKEDAIVFTDVIRVDTNPALPHLSNPILLAKSLVKDLNLPSSMTNSIAVTIAEQLHGLDVKPNITGLMQKDTPKSGELAAAYFERIQVDSDVPSAWKIDDKEENIAKTHHCKAAMPQYNLNQ